MAMADADSVMAIVESRSAEALNDVCLVDIDDGRASIESTSTWSPCRLQHCSGAGNGTAGKLTG